MWNNKTSGKVISNDWRDSADRSCCFCNGPGIKKKHRISEFETLTHWERYPGFFCHEAGL